MDTRRTTMVFDVDYTRDGFSRQRRSGTGTRYRYNGRASTQAPRDKSRPGQEQRPTLVSQIQVWLTTWDPGSAASDAWDHLPALLDAAIERGISLADLQYADREDLKQRIWVRIVGHFKDLDPATELSSLVAWAEKIAKREAIREAQRRKRRARQVRTNETDSLSLDSIVGQVEISACDSDEGGRIVRQTIEEMESDGHREHAKILRLHYLEGRSLRKVAVELSMTSNQVYKKHRRCLELLRLRVAAKMRGDSGA